MNDDRVKLDPLINELVRFKLHESSEIYEAVIVVFDETGYWVSGGSLCEYLNKGEAGCSVDADTRFVELRRIHWIQKVMT